jgi:hypothetical protein
MTEYAAVVSIFWHSEGPDNPILTKYRGKLVIFLFAGINLTNQKRESNQ